MSGIESAEREDYDECQAGVAAVSGEVRQLVSEATGFNREWLAELPRFMIGNIWELALNERCTRPNFLQPRDKVRGESGRDAEKRLR